MNRILTADVILTLTTEQAEALELALVYARSLSAVPTAHERESFAELGQIIGQQCAKHGVQL